MRVVVPSYRNRRSSLKMFSIVTGYRSLFMVIPTPSYFSKKYVPIIVSEVKTAPILYISVDAIHLCIFGSLYLAILLFLQNQRDENELHCSLSDYELSNFSLQPITEANCINKTRLRKSGLQKTSASLLRIICSGLRDMQN